MHKSYSPLFRPNTPDDYKPVARENLIGRYGVVDKKLAGKNYLLGDQFTVADAYLFVVTRWSFPLKLDLSQYANVQAFMARVGERPKVKEAIAAEG